MSDQFSMARDVLLFFLLDHKSKIGLHLCINLWRARLRNKGYGMFHRFTGLTTECRFGVAEAPLADLPLSKGKEWLSKNQNSFRIGEEIDFIFCRLNISGEVQRFKTHTTLLSFPKLLAITTDCILSFIGSVNNTCII